MKSLIRLFFAISYFFAITSIAMEDKRSSLLDNIDEVKEDIEQGKKRLLLIKCAIDQVPFDCDLKELLLKCSQKNLEDLKYYTIPEILNEQQIRASNCLGFLMQVSDYRIVPLHISDKEILQAFYGEDKEKLKKALAHWKWHRRGYPIGLPPQWPVKLKKHVFYSGCSLLILGTYLKYHYGVTIEITF